MKIALVEDDHVIRENYAELLADEGFEVLTFKTRAEAAASFSQELPDLAILDISLNEERDGGFQLCMYLRQRSPTLPILFLTSHGSEIDKISGFRLGADDYLTKDISFEFLIVRIETLLRRHATLKNEYPAPVEAETQHKLHLDQTRLVIFWNNQPVDLTLTQFWIVQALVSDPGQVKTHDQLMKAANIYVEPNTISAHIKAIRIRFKTCDEHFNAIKSERGAGYRWLEEV